MGDKKRLLEYLSALERVLNDWKILRKESSLARLQSERFHCHAACHVILLAIQTAIDIANHIVAFHNWPRPSKSYREAFDTLGREGFLEATLAAQLAQLVDFRNELTHEYVNLDLEHVWKVLEHDDTALAQFVKTVLQKVS